MGMDLQRLRTFRTVATLMNFNQAADVLHYAQSTVSVQIKTLETEVGAELFARIGKRVTLTQAGEKLLNYTHRLLAIEEEALAEVAGKKGPVSHISLRVPQTIATYHFTGVFRDFLPRFPHVRFDMSSCALYSLEHELGIGTVDVAFLLTDSIQAADLNVEMLKAEPLCVVAVPGHRLTRKRRVGYKDLRDETVFLPKADCGYRMVFEQSLAAARVDTARIIESNSLEAIKQWVAAGLGVTVIPEISVRSEMKQGRLTALSWGEDIETAVIMIWHKDKWLSPVLEDFMDTVRRVLTA
jgi:DNA-binding transcriptional LysR family regulator